MKATETKLSGVFLIEPLVFQDNRGFFYESYNYQELEKFGIRTKFYQDNHSRSEQGTIRGLHYQLGSFAQTKLIRCIAGEIYDVVVDLRRKSPTFGQWLGYKLNAANKLQLYVPQGFAHGFSVLSPAAEVCYKCDNYYSPQAERGIVWSDKTLQIDWQVRDPLVSAKDQKLPGFKEIPPTDLF